jgi:hypothetical protein
MFKNILLFLSSTNFLVLKGCITEIRKVMPCILHYYFYFTDVTPENSKGPNAYRLKKNCILEFTDFVAENFMIFL